MNSTQQTEALRLADKYEIEGFLQDHRFAQEQWCRQAAAELRRNYARINELEEQLSAIGAGGVEPLRKQGQVQADKPRFILTVNQMLQAIEFATGGFTPDTEDELETSLTFCVGPLKDADGKTVADCTHCWLTDLAEEGAIPLDEYPTESDLVKAQAPRVQIEARDAARYRWLRDNDWRNDEKMEPVIRLHLNAIWDEKIDAAMAAQARNKKGIEQ